MKMNGIKLTYINFHNPFGWEMEKKCYKLAKSKKKTCEKKQIPDIALWSMHSI